MSKVYNSETGYALEGSADEGLIEASRGAGDTGIVHAYRDAEGLWHYLRSDEVSDADIPGWLPRGSSEVRTVYVEVRD